MNVKSAVKNGKDMLICTAEKVGASQNLTVGLYHVRRGLYCECNPKHLIYHAGYVNYVNFSPLILERTGLGEACLPLGPTGHKLDRKRKINLERIEDRPVHDETQKRPVFADLES